MSTEEILDMVKGIRKNRVETPVMIKKKAAKKVQSTQGKLLAMLNKGEITPEQLMEMMNESKKG